MTQLAAQLAVLDRELGRRYVLRSAYTALGLLCVAAGIVESLLGYAGVIDFQLNIPNLLESRLGNAGPGLVLVLIGLAYSCLAALGFRIESTFRDGSVEASFKAYAKA